LFIWVILAFVHLNSHRVYWLFISVLKVICNIQFVKSLINELSFVTGGLRQSLNNSEHLSYSDIKEVVM